MGEWSPLIAKYAMNGAQGTAAFLGGVLVVATAAVAAGAAVAGEACAVFAFGAVAGVAYVAVEVVGFVAVEIVEGPLAAVGEGAGVAVVGVVAVVDVAVEALAAVIPGACADEDAAVEPVGAIVAIGGAVVGGVVIVAVGAAWGGAEAYADGDLRGCGGDGDAGEEGGGEGGKREELAAGHVGIPPGILQEGQSLPCVRWVSGVEQLGEEFLVSEGEMRDWGDVSWGGGFLPGMRRAKASANADSLRE